MFKPKVKRPGEHTRAGEELGTTAQPLMGSTLNFQPVPRWAQIAVLERTEGEAVSHTRAQEESQRHGLWSNSSIIACVTLDKLPDVSALRFLHL